MLLYTESSYRMLAFRPFSNCLNTMLILEPQIGLCNRMRALEAAQSLSAATGQRVVVVWLITPSLGASFSDLFEPLAGIDGWHEFDTRTPPGRADYARFIEKAHVDRTIGAAEVGSLLDQGFRFVDLDPRQVTHVRTWSRVHPNDNPGAQFKPKPLLEERIESIASRFDKTIGVHIRRTDSTHSSEHSPTIAFVRRMHQALQQGEAENFFLATDDPDEEETLRAAFPGRIIAQQKRSRDRNTAEAIEDAVVDLYCLAATKRLFGSYLSSFSEMAAAIGGIPQETIRLPPLAQSRPDTVLTFGIPLITVTDLRERRFRDRMLSITLASIYAQTDGAFRVILGL